MAQETESHVTFPHHSTSTINCNVIKKYNDTLSPYIDQLYMLLDILDGELSNINSEIPSASGTSIISYDEELDVQRSPAPHATKCFLGCGGRGNGGKVAVDIINSAGNLTSNIINSVAQAAQVVLPPLTNTIENVVGQWINRGKPPQNAQQPTPPGGQPPPGQWVPPGGQLPPGQWVPPGGIPPPGQWVPPRGQQTPGQWMPPGGQQYPGQWAPPGGQQPPFSYPPQDNRENFPGRQQYQNQGYPPIVNVQVNATDNSNASANVGYPLPSPSPTKSIKTQNNHPLVSPPLTRSPLSRSSSPSRSRTQNLSRPYPPDAQPAIQKCYQDIHETLQDMDKCLDRIVVKLS